MPSSLKSMSDSNQFLTVDTHLVAKANYYDNVFNFQLNLFQSMQSRSEMNLSKICTKITNKVEAANRLVLNPEIWRTGTGQLSALNKQ